MLKKRESFFSRWKNKLSSFRYFSFSRKGQLTMFIILGVVILFIFLFLIQMSSQFVLQQLEQSSEDVFSKAFKKEGLRIFVEDCLEDELRDAILLSGKQEYGTISREEVCILKPVFPVYNIFPILKAESRMA